MKKLLLLHGALGSAAQFSELATRLRGEFEIHLFNFAGHGGEVMPEEFSIRSFSDDVVSYIERHNLAPINIFGYSMGGYIALDIATRNPGIVDRVFTFATKFDWSPEIAAREVQMLDPEKIMTKVPAFAEQLSKRHQPNNWQDVMNKTAALMTQLGAASELNLETVEHKVRIGIGDRDTMVSLDESIAAYRRLKNASLLILPETPHVYEKIEVKRLAGEITAFFK